MLGKRKHAGTSMGYYFIVMVLQHLNTHSRNIRNNLRRGHKILCRSRSGEVEYHLIKRYTLPWPNTVERFENLSKLTSIHVYVRIETFPSRNLTILDNRLIQWPSHETFLLLRHCVLRCY